MAYSTTNWFHCVCDDGGVNNGTGVVHNACGSQLTDTGVGGGGERKDVSNQINCHNSNTNK